MSERAGCQRSDARAQIYEAQYTYHDIQSDKVISDSCITARYTGYDDRFW